MPWSGILGTLSSLLENKAFYHQDTVTKGGVRVVKTWGDATTLESRKIVLKEMQENLDHKEVHSCIQLVVQYNKL